MEGSNVYVRVACTDSAWGGYRQRGDALTLPPEQLLRLSKTSTSPHCIVVEAIPGLTAQECLILGDNKIPTQAHVRAYRKDFAYIDGLSKDAVSRLSDMREQGAVLPITEALLASGVSAKAAKSLAKRLYAAGYLTPEDVANARMADLIKQEFDSEADTRNLNKFLRVQG